MKQVVCVFGPDGSGKSSFVKLLHQEVPSSEVLEATHPDHWPDTSWIEEKRRQGADAKGLDMPFRRETAIQCYGLASKLLLECGTVIIDSDIRAQVAAKAVAMFGFEETLEELYDYVGGEATNQIGTDITVRNLHVTVGGLTRRDRAELLVSRILSRGNPSRFDPVETDQAASLVDAFDTLENILLERNEPVLRVETHQDYKMSDIMDYLTA